MARVFLSHAAADRDLAFEFRRWLASAGHEVFLDADRKSGITIGEEWEQQLYRSLRWADAMVCLLTEAFSRSVWCAGEVGAARAQGSRILPILVERGAT